MAFADYIEAILATPPVAPGEGLALGHSREGRVVRGFRFGGGPLRVSLIGGCHADEPVGPLLLRHLAAYLGQLPATHPLLACCDWWLVPHINPDGEARNNRWFDPAAVACDPLAYLPQVVRERPGDDIEFGFPRDDDDRGARPEPTAVHAWWRTAGGPFHVHASLHGMAIAAGPWYLIEAAWAERAAPLMRACVEATHALGYALHDVERRGEKGFHRLGRGFCTRPDSRAMQAYFRTRGDLLTAGRFRPSSMETMRRLGDDCLTLVSEMPLFLTPGVGEQLGPPDPAATAWRARLYAWGHRLGSGESPAHVATEMRQTGFAAMPLRDQMRLQWRFVTAALALRSSYPGL